jgi:hypothetical protein
VLSRAIWGTVFQFSRFQTAAKDETLQLLRELSQTHLATLDVNGAIQTVNSHSAPARHKVPRVLRSPAQGITLGPGSPRLRDDLTERIYAGYWALRLARVHGAADRVAKALNRHRIPMHTRAGNGLWSSYEIRDRLKQFEARHNVGRDLKTMRTELVTHWEALYYPIPA